MGKPAIGNGVWAHALAAEHVAFNELPGSRFLVQHGKFARRFQHVAFSELPGGCFFVQRGRAYADAVCCYQPTR